MPDTQLLTKNWGEANKAALARLVHKGDVGIKDLLSNYINACQKRAFSPSRQNEFPLQLPQLCSRIRPRGKI
jgi:hypothetical protein